MDMLNMTNEDKFYMKGKKNSNHGNLAQYLQNYAC